MNKNLIAIGRILTVLSLVFAGAILTLLIFILFCAHLMLWRIGELYLLEFTFISSLMVIIPFLFIMIIRWLLKQYKVI